MIYSAGLSNGPNINGNIEKNKIIRNFHYWARFLYKLCPKFLKMVKGGIDDRGL